MKKNVRRPQYLGWLVLLCFGQGAMYITYFVLAQSYYSQIQELESLLDRPPLSLSQLVTLWLLLGTWFAFGLASLTIGIGLRQSRPWAWTAAMVLEGAILLISLETYFNRQANILFYVGMTVAVMITFLLNQREIQDFYHAHQAEISAEKFTSRRPVPEPQLEESDERPTPAPPV